VIDWLSDAARIELEALIDARVERALAERAPRWMTVEETAEYLRATPAAIRRRVGRKTIPATKLGGRVLVDRERLDRELEETT
jgi:excisionase family DNA binding protein